MSEEHNQPNSDLQDANAGLTDVELNAEANAAEAEPAHQPGVSSPLEVEQVQDGGKSGKKKGGKGILMLGGTLLCVPIAFALYNNAMPKSAAAPVSEAKTQASAPAAQMPGVVTDGMGEGGRSAVSNPMLPNGAAPGQEASNPEVAKLLDEKEQKRQQSASGRTFVAKIGSLEDRKDQLPPAESLNSQQFPPGSSAAVGGNGSTQAVVTPDTVKRATEIVNRQPVPSKVKAEWYGPSKSDVTPVSTQATQVATPSLKTGTPLAELGEVCLAAVETSLSSYEPGTPVFVRVLSCKNPDMRNAVGVGKFRSTNDKVVVDLTRFRLTNGTEIAASALLVDKSTRRPGIASSVDGHYVERFGLIAAAAFVKTYAAAYANPQQAVYPSGGGAVVVINGKQTQKQAGIAALGDSATAIVTDMQKSQTRINSPEVMLNRGDTVGLMFLETVGG